MKKTVSISIIILFMISCDDQTPYEIQKAYIALQGQDKVAVVNINNGEIIKEVSVDMSNISDMPHYVVIDETHHFWYCTLIHDGSILKFDLATDELIDSVHVGNMPALMALDELNEYLYVSRFMPMMGMSTSSQLIHKIDAQTMTVVGTVDVGADSPHGIALSSDHQTLWVASSQASHFFKIETNRFGEVGYQPENFRIGSDVPASYEINDGFYNALELELSHDDSSLFITCSNSMEVREFDTHTGELLHIYETGMMPWHLQIAEDDNTLYVSNRSGNSVSMIHIQAGFTHTLTQSSMSSMHGCALSGNEDLLVVTSFGSGYAYVYDTQTFSLLQTINFDGTEAMPAGVAVVQQ